MSIRKILAIKFRSMGDTILLTAPIAELKKAFPDAEIHVAADHNWISLLESHPDITRLWPYERHVDTSTRAKALMNLAFKLRREKYDAIVNFHASPSSAALSFAIGTRIRAVHFHGHKDKNRYSTVSIPGKGEIKPIIERDMDVVRAILPMNANKIPTGILPKVYLRSTEVEQAKKGFQSQQYSNPVLGIALGASRPTKIWPLDRFASVAIKWIKETGGTVVTLVEKNESNLSTDFLKYFDDILSVEFPDQNGRSLIRSKLRILSNMTVRELAGVLHEVSVLLGNDSGPRHLAVGVGTKTVTLFGPEHPYEWHPYPEDLHAKLFIEKLSCRKDADPGMPEWCGLSVCHAENHRCMTQIGTDEVYQHCVKRINESHTLPLSS